MYKINIPTSDTLIVSFAGNAKLFGGIPRFEFVQFLKQFDVSKHFYLDEHSDLYHKGLAGITSSIDETVTYLKNEIKDYKRVLFLGNSGGGYAAILFGSLLEVETVVAFVPQTIRHNDVVDEKYRDSSIFINNKTKYYIYGDTSILNLQDCHHISHCERIAHHPNVFLTKKNGLHLKEMRDSGELFDILKTIINR
jgi:hypothetical protein